MGGWGGYNPAATSMSLDQAAEAAGRYLKTYGPNLALEEVMEFARNFYAEAVEEDTGLHAMELLVNKNTGQVYPEVGPNMMWNTKYGMMGQMMGGGYGPWGVTASMPITPKRAQVLAQQFLNTFSPDLNVAEADTLYGYYTLHTLRGDQVEGMLSVNGYTGQVWYHSWHGSFIGMKEFHHGDAD